MTLLRQVASVLCCGHVRGLIPCLLVPGKEGELRCGQWIEGRAGKSHSPQRGIRLVLAGLEALRLGVVDYHTMISSSSLLVSSFCWEGLKNVKYGLISIIAREAGSDGA